MFYTKTMKYKDLPIIVKNSYIFYTAEIPGYGAEAGPDVETVVAGVMKEFLDKFFEECSNRAKAMEE